MSGCPCPIYSTVEVNCWLCTCFEAHWIPMNQGSPWNPVLMEHHQHLYGNRMAKKRRQTTHILNLTLLRMCKFHCVTEFHLQNSKVKISSWWQQNIKSSTEALLNTGLWLHRSCTHEAGPGPSSFPTFHQVPFCFSNLTSLIFQSPKAPILSPFFCSLLMDSNF